MRVFLLVGWLLVCQGCTTWPRDSSGGYAQHYIFSQQFKSSLKRNDRFYPLYLRIDEQNQRLMQLARTRLYRCYPAFFRKFHLLLNKSAQEFAAGFYYESSETVDELKRTVDYIAKQPRNQCVALTKNYQELFRINY